MKLTIIIIVVFVGILFGSGVVSAAGYNDYTINNSYSYSIGLSGNTSNHFVRTGIQLSYIYSQLTNDTSLTYIRYRVKFNGSDARSDYDPNLTITLAGNYNNNGMWGETVSPLQMSTNSRSNSTQGQWYEYSRSFDPNTGSQVANRMLYLFLSGVDEYDYCSFTVEILEVRYRKYVVDITTSITSDRYIELEVNRFSGATDTRVAIQNINDGRWIAGSSNSRVAFSGSNTAYTVIDTGVMPEKTYTYYLYYQVGSSTSIPPVGPIVVLVKVPSDATLAVEQTIDAGSSAAQWAHWANDNAAAAEDMAREARDRADTASTNALNAYNEAHLANTKLNDMQVSITNIQNNMGADTAPPIINLGTLSGARATSGTSIKAFLNVSDNISTTFNYSINGGEYQLLPVNGIIDLPVTEQGVNPIYVRVKDEAGNINSVFMKIRKL